MGIVYNKNSGAGTTVKTFTIRSGSQSGGGYGGLLLHYDYLKQFTKVKPVMQYSTGSITMSEAVDYPSNSWINTRTLNMGQDNTLPALTPNKYYLFELYSQFGICDINFS